MNTGKKRRLKRIMPDGKTVIIPMDHGVTLGPIRGLKNIQKQINLLITGEADAIVIHKGLAKNVETESLGLIVHLSASTRFYQPNSKVVVGTVKEAMVLGADAVSIHVNIGGSGEKDMLMTLGKTAEECDQYGIPLLAMMYPRGEKITNEHDVEIVAHAARLGAELGADIIKTNYTGSIKTFREVIDSCPVPVIIAGGPKVETNNQVLEMVADALSIGCAGVSIGRNVFQHSHPDKMTKALSMLIHKKADLSDVISSLGD